MAILFSVGGIVANLSLEEQIIIAKQAGFNEVDYIASIKDLFSPPNKAIHLTKKYAITIKGVHIPVLLAIHTPKLFINKIVKLHNHFPKSEVLNFHLSGFINPLEKRAQSLEEFIRAMKSARINISCESNRNEYIIFKYYPKETYNPDLFAKFCISHNLPMNLDTSHIAAWDYDLVEFFKKYHQHISLMHLSDMTLTKQHLPFGKGILPLEKLFREMKKVSYRGNVVFEVSNFPKGSSKEYILEELKNCINMFKKFSI